MVDHSSLASQPASQPGEPRLGDLDAFELRELIAESPSALLWRAVSRDGGRPVCIKRHKSPHPTTAEVARFERAYRMAREVAGQGVVECLALLRDGAGLAIVCEDLAGPNLAEVIAAGAVPWPRALALAIELVEALVGVHDHGIAHGDIKPGNVVLARGRQPTLIDFEAAARVARRASRHDGGDTLGGTFFYRAPEQTGRTNRGVDMRADLYAVGVTLFEMISGRLPFEETDPLAFVHALLARRPRRLDEIAPEVPARLAEVVARLLAKDPEDRYQTAAGLAHDLLAIQSGEDLEELQSRDQPARLTIPQRLYGRDAVVADLERELMQVRQGQSAIAYVVGHAGIGKSSVIDELEPALRAARGSFARGRFEPLGRDSPLAGFRRAMSELWFELAPDRAAEDQLREALRRRLSGQEIALAPLITAIRPAETAAGKSGETERVQRRGAVVGLLQLAVEHRGPVVLVVDDLQWADDASLDLLEHVGTHLPAGVMLIGGWRGEEVGASHPLHRVVDKQRSERISPPVLHELGPLPLSAVRELLDDALHLPEPDAARLARRCHSGSGGNPFYLQQLLVALHDEGALAYHDGWQLDVEAMEAVDLDAAVVSFVFRQLRRLPEQSLSSMQVMACLGASCAFDDLVLAAESSREAVQAALDPVLAEGFVSASADGVRLRFLHDGVHESAYESLEPERRQQIHLRIGLGLLARATEDDAALELASHFARAIDLVPAERRDQVVDLLLRAARRSLDASGFALAEQLLDGASKLLGDDGWRADRDRMLRLWQLRARVAESGHDVEAAERLAREAERRGFRRGELLPLYSAWFGSLLARGSKGALRQIADAAGPVLRRYGVDIPRTPGMHHVLARLAKLRLLLPRPLPESEADLDADHDDAAVAAVDLLRRILPVAFRLGEEIAAVYMIEIALLAPRCGRHPVAASAWANAAALLVEVFDDVAGADQLCRVATEVLGDSSRIDLLPDVLFIRRVLVSPWVEHLAGTVDDLDRAWRIALEVGDSQHIGGIPGAVAFHRVFLGEPLGAMTKDVEGYLEVLAQHGSATADLSYLRQYIACLAGDAPDPTRLVGQHFDLDRDLDAFEDQTSRAGMTLCWLMLAVFFGDPGQMAAALEKARPERKGDRHIVLRALWPHYAALARLATLPSGGLARRRALAEVAGWQRRLDKLAALVPMNVEHRVAHVAAARAEATGDRDGALRGYVETARLARLHGWPHEAALAHERAANLLLERGDEASMRGHLDDAVYLFDRWGAEAKLDQLRRRWPQAVATPASSRHSSRSRGLRSSAASFDSPDELDLESVTRAAQAISGEIELDALVERLLDIAVENAGATRGALVRERDGTLRLVAEVTVGGRGRRVVHRDATILGEEGPMSEELARYALALRGPLVIDDVLGDRNLLPELASLRERQARSGLLVPLVRKDEPVGALVLENDLATATFSPARVRLLEVLATQAAISLENA
ncbi:MAG: AAA family ATPase, partial [Myxococcales bacterium]|nr:AAA family ATPase [Myxococcales bacterium]